PEEMLAQLQREQMVRDVISQLSPRCEQMIRMLFFETPPRPYANIASELGLATGSIGFIRGRCLARLKKQLETMGFYVSVKAAQRTESGAVIERLLAPADE